MPCTSAIGESFSDCLVGENGFFANGQKNRFSFNCRRAGFIDKVFKAADPVLDTVGVIAEANGASKETLEAIDRGRSWMKTTRDCTALFNIFQGIIPGFIENCKAIPVLVKGFFSHTDCTCSEGPIPEVTFQARNKPVTAVGKKEMGAALVSQVGKGVAALSFITGFGLCRPIANVNKHILKPTGIVISPVVREMGEAFPTVMMVNHIGGLIGSGADMVYQSLAYERNLEAATTKSQEAKAEFIKKFKEDIVKNGVEVTEKILELMMDIVHHLGQTAPAGFRLPVNLLVGGMGLWKEWQHVQ